MLQIISSAVIYPHCVVMSSFPCCLISLFYRATLWDRAGLEWPTSMDEEFKL